MLLQPATEDIPVDSVELFDREAPVVSEIGVGSGYFLEVIAERRPQVDFLAVERHSASVRRAYNRMRKAGLTNIRLFHGEGRFFLRNLVADRQLAKVFVNFPDPWPKVKDAHHRLFDSSFIRLLTSRLEEGGAAYLTTDHEKYFDWACRQGRESEYVRTETKSPPAIVLESRYARKWQSAGRAIFHAAFRKARHATVESTLETVPMQHSVLEGSLPDLSGFEPIVHAFDDNHVIVKRPLRPIDGRATFFEVHLEEEGLTQDFLLRLRERDDSDRFVLGVDPFGHPIATRGVAEAVGVMTEWLAENGLTVVHSSY